MVQTALDPRRGHNHKVVFVNASYRSILSPSTFRLLDRKSFYDATLKAYLETAYQALRNEADSAARSPLNVERQVLSLPKAFRDLAEADFVTTLLPHTLSLTTLAQIGVALSIGQDFKDAMRDDFAAIWDPESFLPIKLLKGIDVTSTLDLIAQGIEVIKLATWLDHCLDIGNLSGPTFGKQRLTIRDGWGAGVVSAEANSANNVPFCPTLCGIATATTDFNSLEDIKNSIGGDQINGIIPIERSVVPLLNEKEWRLLLDKLQLLAQERRFAVRLTSQSQLDPFPQPSDNSTFVLDLRELLLKLDEGRSEDQVRDQIKLLRQDLERSIVYGPHVSFLLLGGDARERCSSSLTSILARENLPYTPVKLLNLLYPRDSLRYGDEPVKLSKVQGNPCQQVAIVGMSCRVPGANDADELWRLLKEGKDMCQEIPESLYRYQDYHSASYRDRNVMRVKTGNFVSCSSSFDKSILGENLTAEDCAEIDPQQRVAILTAHETLQKAGYGFSPHRHPKRPEQWSTHLAYCSDDYREHLSQKIEANFVPNTHRAHLVARVNEVFGFRGEASTYDTACSSALVAVEAACNSLLSGETTAALTGGINILTQPQITIGLDRGFFLSASSQCMTLDDAGSGYSRADAVSLMLLKRLTDAVRDGDPILAVISSAATNHSGESFSITHPHGPTQKRLYQAGMLASNTLPRDYTYIEMHGTGTQSGDFEEVSGIVDTFGAGKRGEEADLVLGSVKANIGHSEAASGASSMIKTVQIYEHGEVPRHIGIRTKLNTKLPPLVGLHVPLQETKLERVDTAFTLVDNFSAAGGNSSIVMDRGTVYRERLLKMSENAREKHSDSDNASATKHHLLLVSAATPFSLDAKRRRLIAFLEQNKDIDLTEFCSAVSLSDPMYPHRLVATPSNLAEAKSCLSSQESVHVVRDGLNKATPVIGIAFSGQGAQYLDMARELYGNSAAFRGHIDSCNTIVVSLGLPNLVEVIHPVRGPSRVGQRDETPVRKADSFSPAQYQLALIASEVGLASMLRDWGLKPSCVVGHSLGEYAALWMAGVMSLRSMLELVGRRAVLMMEMCEPNASSMLAIRENHIKVRELLQQSGYDQLEIACLNSPNDTVVAGCTEDIEKMLRLCEQHEPKIKAMAIPVPYAFHSRAVEPLMEKYQEVASSHRLSEPQICIASNVLGKLMKPQSDRFDAQYLIRHLRQPVRFAESILDLQEKIDVDVWIEIGPHPTCIPMLKGCYTESDKMPSFIASFRRGSSSWTATLDLVKELASRGIDLDWDRAFQDLGLRFCHNGLSAKLPLYPFDLDEYWVPFKDRGLRDHLLASARDAETGILGADKKTRQQTTAAPQMLPKPHHSLLSQCVRLETDSPYAMFLSCVNQKPFRDFILGHIILGVPLAPATVFVELAQEAAMYWWRANAGANQSTNQQEEDVNVEVLDLSMVSSLYLNEYDPKQQIEVSLQGSPSSADGSIISFFSHSEHQHQKHQYSSCRVRITNTEAVTREWSKLRHLITSRAEAIKKVHASLMKTDTIYRNFEAIVLYLGGFRGMQTIWMTERADEAVSEVQYNAAAINGRFLCSPMLLDSLGGLTGFISNVGFAEGSFIYMAEAIGRIATLPMLSRLQPGSETKVQVYARMEQDKDLSKGSAYFFLSDGQLAGMMEGIVFKRIRRDMLTRLVQLSSKAFANEAAKAVKDRESKAEVAKPIQPQAKPQATKSAAPQHKGKERQTVTYGENNDAQCHSPLDALTDCSKRFSYAPPLHISGPQLRHFDGQNVLFLLPDGSGTAQSYKQTNASSTTLSIYGFDSPYLGHIGAWSRGIAELVDRYIEMLSQVQTRGPYKLAGWSIGGVFALEIARRLLSSGHEVAFLGLIDTPSSRQIKPLPTDTLEAMLARISSKTVREHFKSCALTLPGYRCLPFQEADKKPTKVTIVNAADGSPLKDVMANAVEWRSFWLNAANLTYHEVSGDHWSCLEPALRIVIDNAP